MRNIIKIFRHDLQGLLKNFLALVVAVGLCLLPALYAWFNIYANWDPYANTGNIKIAVVNLDEGWTSTNGEFTNMGDNIVESLKEKDSINWIFLDAEDDAVSGVEAGDYYAAIVIDVEFTYSMYNGIAESVSNPKITYYVNDKKNAVATKITDSAVSSVTASINKQFVNAIVTKLFEETNGISEEFSDEDSVDAYIAKLEAVDESLKIYNQMIEDFMEGNEMLAVTASSTSDQLLEGQEEINSGIDDLEEAQAHLDSTQASFNTFSHDVQAAFDQIESSLNTISRELEEAKLEDDAAVLEADLEAIARDAQELSQTLDTLTGLMDTIGGGMNSGTVNAIKQSLDVMSGLADSLSDITSGIDSSAVTAAIMASVRSSLETYTDTVKQLNEMYQNQIVPQVNNLIDSMDQTIESVQGMLTSLSSATGTMSNVFLGVSNTLDTLNMSLSELQTVLLNAETKIDDTLNRLEGASESEQIEILLNLLAGDPESLGTFFSEPVQVENHYVYEIANYGSGVAPFYTTLAIWVGMTILVSLIKVHAHSDGLENVLPSQLYFGRYLLFLLLSQIQTLVIVIGDLLLLGVQCVHPFAFWFAASVTSLTFSLLVYSLTLAFGDIGKAFAVVIMVIQIAGSGGTFPIEALPSFFRSVYIFFPFPYAINAMRECIGGMYENDYGIYLMQLGFFCVAALIIGLFVRIPFIGLNEYIEERMEDTELM